MRSAAQPRCQQPLGRNVAHKAQLGTHLMRRDVLPAVPSQAIQHASASKPDAVLSRHQHPVDIDCPHRQSAIVHAFERRRKLDDIAP